ncbi:MAG: regulatory protein RecX [bacterium]
MGDSASGDYSKAMNAALRLLSFRPRTERELSSRLREKGFTLDVVDRVCGRLKGLGYVDDRQFAISWLKSFSGQKCRSAWVLKRELKKKGIAPELADTVVEENFDGEDVFRAACDLARQRMSKASARDTDKAKARVQNLLLRRGFDYDFIRRVMAEIACTTE